MTWFADIARWWVVVAIVALASLPARAVLPESWSVAVLAVLAAAVAQMTSGLVRKIRLPDPADAP